MPSTFQIDQRQSNHTAQQIATKKQTWYQGPVIYRGEEINWKHSIKRVVKTLRRSLLRSQFASLNVVGIPGSGKTVLAGNVITDLVEEEYKETGEQWNVFWKGAEELRHLGEVLEALPKNTNNIVVFDDVSKALDQLSSAEQSEVFEQLTTTRHTTGGRLLIISLYHYTFANLKSVKSQSVVVIYTSITLTEMGNITQMLQGKANLRKLDRFAKVYESAFMNGSFDLAISETKKRTFIDSKPFRPCFVVNLFRVHIALFMRLENGYQAPNQSKEKINSEALVKYMTQKWNTYGPRALRLSCMLHGHPEAIDTDLFSAFRTIEDLAKNRIINWASVSALVKIGNKKRGYTKKKVKRETIDLIVKESREIPEPETPIIREMSEKEAAFESGTDPDIPEEDDFSDFHNINKPASQDVDDV